METGGGGVSSANGFARFDRLCRRGCRRSCPCADCGVFPLGAARAQMHETYIVAQTEDGIVIVDQHAAHERLVYERMKQMLANGGVRQTLLIPEVVELDPSEAERVWRARRGIGPAWAGDRAVRRPAPFWCAKRRRCLATSTRPALLQRSRRRHRRTGRSACAEGAAGGGVFFDGVPGLGARGAAA